MAVSCSRLQFASGNQACWKPPRSVRNPKIFLPVKKERQSQSRRKLMTRLSSRLIVILCAKYANKLFYNSWFSTTRTVYDAVSICKTWLNNTVLSSELLTGYNFCLISSCGVHKGKNLHLIKHTLSSLSSVCKNSATSSGSGPRRPLSWRYFIPFFGLLLNLMRKNN